MPTRSRRDNGSSLVVPKPIQTVKQERPSLSSAIIDLSWKDGGTVYPKSSSRIGEQYQVTMIPSVQTKNAMDEDDNVDWDGTDK